MFSCCCADPDCHANGCRLLRRYTQQPINYPFWTGPYVQPINYPFWTGPYVQPINYPFWTGPSISPPLTEDDIRRIVREELERKEQK